MKFFSKAYNNFLTEQHNQFYKLQKILTSLHFSNIPEKLSD